MKLSPDRDLPLADDKYERFFNRESIVLKRIQLLGFVSQSALNIEILGLVWERSFPAITWNHKVVPFLTSTLVY
jgi:hypothetical protein